VEVELQESKQERKQERRQERKAGAGQESVTANESVTATCAQLAKKSNNTSKLAKKNIWR
jgi:hypothetical protein